VAASLVIPFAALVAFWDPHVRVGLRFGEVAMPDAEGDEVPEPVEQEEPPEPPEAAGTKSDAPAQVVSLDAFRRRPTRE
jgi:hypothetical protein